METADDRILLIGEAGRELVQPLAALRPRAQITAVNNFFDAIAELAGGEYGTVLAAAEPIEHRAESAVRTLRELIGSGKLILYGESTTEPVSRRMLACGCDDYVVTPTTSQELSHVLGSRMRLVEDEPQEQANNETRRQAGPRAGALAAIPMTEILLDCLIRFPSNAGMAAVKDIAARLAPAGDLRLAGNEDDPPTASDGQALVSHPVRGADEAVQVLHLLVPRDEDEAMARHFLSHLAGYLSHLATLTDRHNGLQKLAIMDELTGLYNARYFRHFLAKIIDRAKARRFPVTLLVFDIDDFKRYNDQFGHNAGDEILKQTAAMMKQCCREHDLVARLSGGGDEFAVVFWEKDGPRSPREPGASAGTPGRPPQTPLEIAERFRKTIATGNFSDLGPAGQGILTISGGLAVYPYDAQTPEALIAAADHALMFGAKAAGKNSIYLIGGDGKAQEHGE